MDKHVFWIILLLDIYCAYSVENVQNNGQMSQESARDTCVQTGGSLVSYKSVKSNPTSTEYLSQLQEGQSAWISGSAKLSPFLAWHGCFNWTHMRRVVSVFTVDVKNKSLYMCYQACLDYTSKIMYIGIKNRSCYCFNNMSQHEHAAAVGDSLCSLICENNSVDSCGGHSLLSMYRIIETGRLNWARNEPSKRQCVYAKRHESRWYLHTGSCHTLQSVNINGYICMNSISLGSTVTSTCPKEDATNVFCIVNTPSSRQEAFTSCLERRGKLADLSSEAEVPSKVEPNFKYWISVYRTFGISESYTENGTICLAAVRVNDTLYLEPGDCSEQKHYLCEKNTVTHSSHYPDITSNTNSITPLTKPDTGPITIDTKSNTGSIITVLTTLAISVTTKAPGNGNVSPFAYIIPSILLVAFLVILVVLVLYRRRKKRIRQNNFTPDDTYTANYETDNLENGQTVSAVSSSQGQNVDSKRLAAESTPNKSVRQTQRVKTEALGDKRKKTGKEMQTEDYDKIDFKQPVNVRKDAYVYKHVLDTTDSHYDTTKAIKLFQSVGPCESDDTYSHMKGDVSTGDYFDLSVPGKKQDDRGKDTAVNYSYSKNVGQKDSSLSTDKHSRFVIVADDSQDDMKNDDDAGEPTHPDEPITYTKISKVSAKN